MLTRARQLARSASPLRDAACLARLADPPAELIERLTPVFVASLNSTGKGAGPNEVAEAARDFGAAVINSQRLYRMRDGRPVEAQQIHARVGQYPHLFIREGTFIKLAE